MSIILSIKLLATLLLAPADLTFVLFGDILVNWFAHFIPDILAILH